MATTAESRIKKEYIRRITPYKSLGCVVERAFAAGRFSERGWPDRDGCANGKAFYIEFKAGHKAPMTDIQRSRRDQIRKAGGAYFLVCDSTTMSNFFAWLDDVVKP